MSVIIPTLNNPNKSYNLLNAICIEKKINRQYFNLNSAEDVKINSKVFQKLISNVAKPFSEFAIDYVDNKKTVSIQLCSLVSILENQVDASVHTQFKKTAQQIEVIFKKLTQRIPSTTTTISLGKPVPTCSVTLTELEALNMHSEKDKLDKNDQTIFAEILNNKTSRNNKFAIDVVHIDRLIKSINYDKMREKSKTYYRSVVKKLEQANNPTALKSPLTLSKKRSRSEEVNRTQNTVNSLLIDAVEDEVNLKKSRLEKLEEDQIAEVMDTDSDAETTQQMIIETILSLAKDKNIARTNTSSVVPSAVNEEQSLDNANTLISPHADARLSIDLQILLKDSEALSKVNADLVKFLAVQYENPIPKNYPPLDKAILDFESEIRRHRIPSFLELRITGPSSYGVFNKNSAKIPKGAFVGVISGEYFLDPESTKSQFHVYKKELFDTNHRFTMKPQEMVDFFKLPNFTGLNSINPATTLPVSLKIDSSNKGNFTKFIKLSDVSNVIIKSYVFYKCFPFLVLFASKEIHPGEELLLSKQIIAEITPTHTFLKEPNDSISIEELPKDDSIKEFLEKNREPFAKNENPNQPLLISNKSNGNINNILSHANYQTFLNLNNSSTSIAKINFNGKLVLPINKKYNRCLGVTNINQKAVGKFLAIFKDHVQRNGIPDNLALIKYKDEFLVILKPDSKPILANSLVAVYAGTYGIDFFSKNSSKSIHPSMVKNLPVVIKNGAPKQNIKIDGRKGGNFSRLLRFADKDTANLSMIAYETEEQGWQLLLYAKKNINPGEELTLVPLDSWKTK